MSQSTHTDLYRHKKQKLKYKSTFASPLLASFWIGEASKVVLTWLSSDISLLSRGQNLVVINTV